MKEIKYQSIEQILNNEKYPFTKGQIRAFLINRDVNGLNKAIRKIGRRIYIRIDLFDEWIEGFLDDQDQTLT